MYKSYDSTYLEATLEEEKKIPTYLLDSLGQPLYKIPKKNPIGFVPRTEDDN